MAGGRYRAVTYPGPMGSRDAERIQRKRVRAREADPEGFAEKRREEMADYRRKKRVAALEPVVEMIQRQLDAGGSIVDVATALEALGVRPGKAQTERD